MANSEYHVTTDPVKMYLEIALEETLFRATEAETLEDSALYSSRLSDIAIEIAFKRPEFKESFYELLHCNFADARLVVAHHILEIVDGSPRSIRKQAIKEIRRKARSAKSPEQEQEKIWLSVWYMLHPLDRFLF